jgi:hypothetical protein
MDSQKRLTESVRVFAVLHGDTNEDLARALEQSTSSAAGKRTGRIPWTDQDVQRLAKHYGVPSSVLLEGPRVRLGLPDVDAA